MQIALSGNPVVSGLFLWALVGVWVYRDAKRGSRPAPVWRGIGWGSFGVAGLLEQLFVHGEMERKRLLWLGGSILLFALWAVLVIGSRRWPDRAWALLVAGLYVLYWQFSREEGDGGEDSFS